MKIAIIGAGITGLTAAYRLSQCGHCVTVVEEGSTLGGLASAFQAGDEHLDRFYHHVFTSDLAFAQLIQELGLTGQLEWFEPKNAVFIENRLFPFTSPMDLLRFTPLSFISRIKTGMLTLTSRFIKDYTPFERITARDWLIERAGRDSYDKVWGPLLESKFDRDASRVSGTWIWNKFKLRGSSRGKNISKEQLGYMRGSFALTAQRLAERVGQSGGAVLTGKPITGIIRNPDGRFILKGVAEDKSFDRVLFTAAPQILATLETPLSPEYKQSLIKLESKANLCLALELKNSLSPYYWITVAQKDIPFVLVIEHTRLVGLRGYGSHIVYLSRYIDASDPLFNKSDDEITDIFLEGLKKLFPGFDRDDVKRATLSRAYYAQPLVVQDYSTLIPSIKTPVEGLYLASMPQIYPEDRGINYAVRLGFQASDEILKDL